MEPQRRQQQRAVLVESGKEPGLPSLLFKGRTWRRPPCRNKLRSTVETAAGRNSATAATASSSSSSSARFLLLPTSTAKASPQWGSSSPSSSLPSSSTPNPAPEPLVRVLRLHVLDISAAISSDAFEIVASFEGEEASPRRAAEADGLALVRGDLMYTDDTLLPLCFEWELPGSATPRTPVKVLVRKREQQQRQQQPQRTKSCKSYKRVLGTALLDTRSTLSKAPKFHKLKRSPWSNLSLPDLKIYLSIDFVAHSSLATTPSFFGAFSSSAASSSDSFSYPLSSKALPSQPSPDAARVDGDQRQRSVEEAGKYAEDGTVLPPVLDSGAASESSAPSSSSSSSSSIEALSLMQLLSPSTPPTGWAGHEDDHSGDDRGGRYRNRSSSGGGGGGGGGSGGAAAGVGDAMEWFEPLSPSSWSEENEGDGDDGRLLLRTRQGKRNGDTLRKFLLENGDYQSDHGSDDNANGVDDKGAGDGQVNSSGV